GGREHGVERGRRRERPAPDRAARDRARGAAGPARRSRRPALGARAQPDPGVRGRERAHARRHRPPRRARGRRESQAHEDGRDPRDGAHDPRRARARHEDHARLHGRVEPGALRGRPARAARGLPRPRRSLAAQGRSVRWRAARARRDPARDPSRAWRRPRGGAGPVSRRLRVYLVATALAAAAVLSLGWPPAFARDWGHYVAWVVICLVSETIWSNTLSGSATWSLSATAGLSSAVLWGHGAGIWISA